MTRTVRVVRAGSRYDVEGNQNLSLGELGSANRLKPKHEKRRPARDKACATVCAFCLIALFTSCGGLTGVNSNLPIAITMTKGSPQSATVGSSFSVPLAVTVVDSDSNPVGGVSIRFAAPTTGASGTFANGMSTETDTTNASGVATSSPFVANPIAGGPYSVEATTTGVAKAANFILTNTTVVCQ